MHSGEIISPQRVTPWSLFIWVIALLAYVVAIFNRGSLAALGPATQEHFNVDATVLGTFAVMQVVLYVFMQIPVGIFVQRFGPTTIILAGALLMTLGQALLAVAPQVWLAVAARILVGIGDAGTFVSVLRVIANWLPARQAPIWTQLTSQFGQLGQIAAVAPLALLVALQGWTLAFLAVAGITFINAVMIFVFLSDRRGEQTLVRRAFRPTPLEGPSERLGAGIRRQFRGIPKLWRIPGVRLAYWVHFTPPFATGAFLILWGFPFLMGGVGLSATAASGFLSLTVLLGITYGLLIGPLVIRFRAHRERIVIGTVVLIAASWLIVLLWPGTPPLWSIVFMIVCLGMGFPISMVSFDILRDFAPKELVSVGTGLVNTAGFVCTILALFLVGFLLDLQDAGTPETYNLTAFRVAMTAPLMVGLVGLALLIREHRVVQRLARLNEA